MAQLQLQPHQIPISLSQTPSLCPSPGMCLLPKSWICPGAPGWSWALPRWSPDESPQLLVPTPVCCWDPLSPGHTARKTNRDGENHILSEEPSKRREQNTLNDFWVLVVVYRTISSFTRITKNEGSHCCWPRMEL